MKIIACAALCFSLLSANVYAESISTHVLDLAKGVGGEGVPVTLSKKNADGTWVKLASAKTDTNGRVKQFEGVETVKDGIYRLDFDMTGYSSKPFFPEISVSFQVDDATKHYHVPVVVSPYGYSTYRGN